MDGDDLISMFDGVQQLITKMDVDTKARISQTLLVLLACAEDDSLNMHKVASMMELLTDGEMRFER